MARAKKTSQAINVQISPPLAENEAETETRSPEAIELDAALESLPEGTIAKLYRIEPNGEKAYIDQTTPSAMDEARIASHGAGRYIVVMRGPLGDGTNRVGYKGQRQVFIGESAARAAAAALKTEPAASSPNAGGSLLDQVAGGMLVSMMQQMQNMNALQMQQSREHSTAMMTMLSKIAERPATDPLIASLLPALLEKKADPIDQATRIAELSSKGTKSTTELLATLELVEKMREMAGSSGGGGTEKGWMGMVRELAPLVLRQNQQEIATGPVLPSGPPNDQPPTVPGTVPPNIETDLQYLDPLAPYLGHVEISARNGTDPEIAADFFLSFISAGLYPVIDGILARPSVVPDIVKRAPSLAPYQAWLVKLAGAMRNVIAESTADGDGDGEPGG